MKKTATIRISKRAAAKILAYSEKTVAVLAKKGELGPRYPDGKLAKEEVLNAKRRWGSSLDSDEVGPKEAARILGVSLITVHRYVLDGKLKPIQRAPNCQIRLHRDDVERIKPHVKPRKTKKR